MKKTLSLVLALCMIFSVAGMGTIFAETVVANGVTVCSDSSKLYVSVEAYDHFTDYYSIDDEEFVEDPTPVEDGEFVVARVFMKGVAAYNTLNIALAFDPAKVQPCTTKASNGDVQYIPTDAKWNNGSSPAKTMLGVASGYEAYVSEYHAPGSIDAAETEYVIFGVFGIQGETTIQTSEDDMTEICAFKFKRMEGASLDGAISFFKPVTDAGKGVYTNAWIGLEHGCWMNDLTANQMADQNNHIVPSAFVIDGVGGTVTPPAPVVTSVVASVDDAELIVGETANVTVTANYDNGDAIDVTADATVVVSEGLSYENGVITALAAGDATVTATYADVTSEAVAVTVAEPAPTVEAVSLSIDNTELLVGEYTGFSVKCQLSNGDSAPVEAPEFIFGTEGVLAYENGVLNAVAAGTTTVAVTFEGVTSEEITVTVAEPVVLSGIEVAVDAAELMVGETANVTVTASYSDGTTVDVTADSVVTVTDELTYAAGVITAVADGSATVTAEYKEFTDSATVTVVPVPVVLEAVTVVVDNAVLMVGDTANVTVTASYSDGTTADVTADAVVEVSTDVLAYEAGVITAIAAGDASVSATFEGVTSEVVAVSVSEVPVTLESVEVVIVDTVLTVGDTANVLVYANYSDGTYADVTASANVVVSEGLAYENGMITAIAEGAATVSAVYNEVASNVVAITVEAAPVVLTGIEISVDNVVLTVGDTANVTVTATYSDGTTADVTADAAVSVSEGLNYANGVITAISEGAATVSATYEGITAQDAAVTVEAAPVVLTGIEIAVEATELTVGDTTNVVVTASYSDGTTADVTADSVVAVSAGLAYEAGVITAIEAGLATVSATFEGMETETVEITVAAAPVAGQMKGDAKADEIVDLNDVTHLAKYLANWTSINFDDIFKYNANVYRADQADINADFGANEAGVELYINVKDITKLLQFVNEIGVDEADKVWNVDLNAAD